MAILLGGAKFHEHGPLKPEYQKFKARIVILLKITTEALPGDGGRGSASDVTSRNDGGSGAICKQVLGYRIPGLAGPIRARTDEWEIG